MLQKILGIILGIIAGFLFIGLWEYVGGLIWTTPDDIDLSDPEIEENYFQNLPAYLFIFIWIGWMVGTFLAAYLAQRVSRSFTLWVGYVAGGILLATTLVMLFYMPHPVYIWIMVLIGLPAALVMGARLGAGKFIDEKEVPKTPGERTL